MIRRIRVAVLMTVLVTCCARADNLPSTDLSNMSLEDLMSLQVTSVSKKEQKLSQIGASVFVITQDDIRRSGANNIPDLLRMVPGVTVAQIDYNKWAISIRGFADMYADKVLVLVDGRSVYNEAFSGVRWDELDMPLEDIDRIEVVRGPGGTVWGANAMNGVINIITKSAAATPGGLLVTGTGSEMTAAGLVQYGGALKSGSYRVFAQYENVDTSGSRLTNQFDAADGWHSFHGGFRSDWNLSQGDSLTVQGDFTSKYEGQTLVGVVKASALPLMEDFNDRIHFGDGNMLGRWTHHLANGSEISVEGWDEYYVKRDQGMRQAINTSNLDFQHHLRVSSSHDVVWGLGYRAVSDDFVSGYNVAFLPLHRVTSLSSAFVQDEITLTHSLSLTVGSKFEHNAYTGFEYEPSAQLVWDATKRHTIWISAARAIRQPARLDSDMDVNLATFPLSSGSFCLTEIFGTSKLKAEKLHAFEIGHRAQVNRRLSVDSTAFLGFYRDLGTVEPGAPYLQTTPLPYMVFPEVVAYTGKGTNYGLEAFANWQINNRWKISPGVALLHLNLQDLTGQGGTLQNPSNSPRHTFQMRSDVNLTRTLEWDASVSSVGALGVEPLGAIPAYTRVDTRLGWHVGESAEFSVTGQNLLSPRHAEFPDAYFTAHTLMERSVFGKLTWRF